MRCVRLIGTVGGVLVSVLAGGAVGGSAGTERYEADVASSQVTITGTSTLHDWHVEGRQVRGSMVVPGDDLDALWGHGDSSARPLAPTVRVEIPVSSLTSGTRGMDEKVREALQATAHPVVTYRLESAEVAARQAAQANGSEESLTVNTHGVLAVAGVERPVDIPMRIRRVPEHRLEITGETALRMTEFGIDPPRAILGTLRVGDTVHVQWVWVVARGHSDAPDAQAPFPVSAEALMPLEARHGVYLVTEGPEKGAEVPFTLEPRGDRWLLTKSGLAQHELHRDREGNLVIDRETDLREDRQIDYASPVLLLPATVDAGTPWTGTTPVTVRSTRSQSVHYRGVCHWELQCLGVRPIHTPSGIVASYHLRATRTIRLPLAEISMTIAFEYARGHGMIATGVDQVIHSLGLFTTRDVWRLEQLSE